MRFASRLTIAAVVGLHLFACGAALAKGLTIPVGDASIADSISGDLTVPYTAAELAVPPVGEIQKSYLREINRLSRAVDALISALPAGPSGQGSPWYAKVVSFKSGLNALAASRLQFDGLALIPHIVGLLASKQSDAPAFAVDCAGIARDCSPVVVHAMERYIINQNANISAPSLIEIIKVFRTPGFIAEGDWEESPMPVDSAGVMILDAAAVVAYFKTRPWPEADHFLGKATAAEAFARYAASGNGMAVLKAKRAANPAAIAAKWDELAAWVGTQRPTK